jgi:hypothetical protein
MKRIEYKYGEKVGNHGMTFVRDYESKTANRKAVFKCCNCGNEFITFICNIKKEGHTRSCGCITTENALERSNHRLYSHWKHMKERCTNPKHPHYHHYYGRGITVCDEWFDFDNFKRDMDYNYSIGLTLDRIDNDKGYYKENCKWSTRSEQNLNKRVSGKIKYRGVCINKKSKRPYQAAVRVGDKIKHIGTFDTDIEAAIAYDQYVKSNNLKSRLNFYEQ